LTGAAGCFLTAGRWGKFKGKAGMMGLFGSRAIVLGDLPTVPLTGAMIAVEGARCACRGWTESRRRAGMEGATGGVSQCDEGRSKN
jgi:heme A synthase